MEILPTALQTYLDTHCDLEPGMLITINRETNLKVLKPHMISGHYQGRLLSMISKMLRPQCILEIGTYTAYATICLAEGLVRGGEIHTIEVNLEREEMIKNHIKNAGFEKIIFPHFGDARQIMLQLSDKNYDLVFIDADKKSNYAYYQLVMDQLKPGGVIMVDNVLWKGKVYSDAADTDTKLIREFNNLISNDVRVEKLILPVRDGIMLIRKK